MEIQRLDRNNNSNLIINKHLFFLNNLYRNIVTLNMNFNKRKDIFESIRPKNSKKKKHSITDTDDDIDSENDSDDSDNFDSSSNDLTNNSKIQTKAKSKQESNLKLPGGIAKSVNKYEFKCLGSGVGEAPRAVVNHIRNYLDILINSAVLEAKYITSSEVDRANSLLAIPGIVSAILEYNNISFKTIKYCVTRVDLFEPVWYTYNIAKNELILYINESMYEEFCSKNNNDPVIFTSGIIPIEIFNPYETNPEVEILQSNKQIIHCAIASDHVAQHIINDLYGGNKASCSDIHHKFNEIGTTLHSMFHIERTCTKMPKKEYSNYLTLGGHSTSSPMSTQRIMDNILQQQYSSSSNFAYSI